MKNLRSNKMDKIEYKLRFIYIRMLKIINEKWYLKAYKKLLTDYGMKICSDNGYIDPSAFFDNYDYSKIVIGENVTISREVLFLTHDWSIQTGLRSEGIIESAYFLKKIILGNNVFVGAKAILLPGTEIGDNTIIGAGAVVKGIIPAGVIVTGNPAKVIGLTESFVKKHLVDNDYISNKERKVE